MSSLRFAVLCRSGRATSSAPVPSTASSSSTKTTIRRMAVSGVETNRVMCNVLWFYWGITHSLVRFFFTLLGDFLSGLPACLPAWLTNECWRFFWWMHRGIAEYSDCDAWRWMAWGQSGLKWAGGLLLLLLCFCFLLVVHVVLPSHIRQAPFCVTELWEEKQKKNGEVAVIRRTLETKIGWSSRHESTCVTEAATQCWICFAYKYPSDQISVEGN